MPTDSLTGLRVCMLLFNTMDPDPRVWREAETLASNGASVRIFALKAPDQPEHTAANGFDVHRFSRHAPTNMNPPKALAGIFDTVRALWREPFDVYHCHDAATLPVGYLLSRKARAALVYDSHEYAPDRVNPVALRTRKQRLIARYNIGRLSEPLIIRRASRVITVSESISDMLTDRYDLPTRPAVLRNIPRYREPSAASFLREQLNLDANAKVLLYQGVSAPGRGTERCIEVLGHIPNSVLVLAGRIDPWYRSELLSKASKMGVDQRLHLLGQLPFDELHDVTSQADVGLFLAKPRPISAKSKYSLPNKVFEYVMARLPMVVMNDRPEIKRLVDEYGVGLAVDPDNTEDLVETVKKVLYNSELRTRVRQACDRAARNLNWENEMHVLLRVYEDLLGSTPKDRTSAIPSHRGSAGQ